MDDDRSHRHRARLTGRVWAVALAWSSACSVYTDDLLPPLDVAGGSGGQAGGVGGVKPMGGSVSGSSEGGGGTAPRAGTESGGSGGGGGGAAGAPDLPGGAGAGLGGMSAAGEGGMGGDGNDAGDGSGTPDACPNDPNKVAPGACGCGVAESCAPLRAALRHRYSFATAGVTAVDSVGDADATIVGTTAASGKVTFDGTAAAYVDLPNGIISELGDASFELWLTWAGGTAWQRILDFGDNDKAEGQQGTGKTYLYLTPREGSASNALRASFTRNGLQAETIVRASAPLPSATQQHLALVVDDTNNQLRLYLNGELSALTGFQGALSEIRDVNNWIGRSNYADPPFGGTIEELRIYGAALTNAQVQASAAFGPNPSFL